MARPKRKLEANVPATPITFASCEPQAPYDAGPGQGTPKGQHPDIVMREDLAAGGPVPATTQVADGLPRRLSDRGAAYFGDVRLPIVGRVSMDSMTLDISALPEGTLKLGTLVELIGDHQTLEDVADAAGTISYEILTSLGQRYHREYVPA